MSIKMVVTDLDGTLLRDDKTICERDRRSFEHLGNKQIVRVAATGRSLFAVEKVLPGDFPFDYIVFSTGTGIYDVKSKKIILSHSLKSREINEIAKVLFSENLDFTIHAPIPNNHTFQYYLTENENAGFRQYREFYRECCSPLEPNHDLPNEACQFLTIMENSPMQFERIKQRLSKFKVIRTTSPFDHNSLWMEIFPKNVSKGDTVAWLCEKLNITPHQVLAIGNDFNDIDFLNYAGHSRLVENGHDELKGRYRLVPSNNNNGVSEAIREFIPLNF
ncbi:MAG TPA: HAD family hydrolase [Salinivirgaceae bacterium]|nr:HAD family hydrolase [Salinivirgaceae bacterium]